MSPKRQHKCTANELQVAADVLIHTLFQNEMKWNPEPVLWINTEQALIRSEQTTKKNYTEHEKSNTSDLLWIIFIIIIIIDFFLQNSYLTDDNPYSFSSSSYPVLSKKNIRCFLCNSHYHAYQLSELNWVLCPSTYCWTLFRIKYHTLQRVAALDYPCKAPINRF